MQLSKRAGLFLTLSDLFLSPLALTSVGPSFISPSSFSDEDPPTTEIGSSLSAPNCNAPFDFSADPSATTIGSSSSPFSEAAERSSSDDVAVLYYNSVSGYGRETISPKNEALEFDEAKRKYFRTGSMENPNWILDCSLIDEMPVSGADFGATDDAALFWQSPGFDGSSSVPRNVSNLKLVFWIQTQTAGISSCVMLLVIDLNGHAESGSRKRARPESQSAPGSKACREKMRRDRLNDKFVELGSILDPGKPPKIDKAAILTDAARMVTQLRSEAQKLKDSNESLQEKIRELKSEKIELRDEKQRLKAEKDGLEQQIKVMSMPPSYLPYPPMMPNPFIPPAQAQGGKLMMPSFIGYPGFIPHFQAPANVDDKDELPPAA